MNEILALLPISYALRKWCDHVDGCAACHDAGEELCPVGRELFAKVKAVKAEAVARMAASGADR